VIKRQISWRRRITLPLLGLGANTVLSESIKCLGEKSFAQGDAVENHSNMAEKTGLKGKTSPNLYYWCAVSFTCKNVNGTKSILQSLGEKWSNGSCQK